ncbi:MAG: sulfite reductase subunit A [Verrucomicrobia bacterium]|nr:MAG: sulfite reductase subunit A [Verrucomicrobiota bacterium]
MNEKPETHTKYLIDPEALDALLDRLKGEGFTLIGPRLRDDTIVYDEISCLDDLPKGWTDEHEAGTYRLRKRTDGAYFGYNLGPQSWKQFLHPPKLRLWRAERKDKGFEVIEDDPETIKYAFIGVRPCELAALSIQDRVFMGDQHTESHYANKRRSTFVFAVNCSQAGKTCFCASMGTGPSARSGYDLCLTEIIKSGTHRFVVDAGSDKGRQMLEGLTGDAADDELLTYCVEQSRRAEQSMIRHLDHEKLGDAILRNPEHPRWTQVADRCLCCANCTLVCPTCFCTTVEDTTDLTGDHAERWRQWDSCFNLEFSHISGGSVRTTGKSRYRQWLTHKLATWRLQFGTSGCVGCGRCITWCPVGIDLTEEAAALGSPSTHESVP